MKQEFENTFALTRFGGIMQNSIRTASKIVSVISMLILVNHNTSPAAQVGVFKSAIPLNQDTTLSIAVPSGTVALSSNVPIAGDTTRMAVKEHGASVMFVVDWTYDQCHSESWQNRSVRLVHDVVDTIAIHSDKYPGVECGLVLYGHMGGDDLYYDSTDDSALVTYPGRNGAYLPLLNLSQTYPKSKGNNGRQIIDALTKSDSLYEGYYFFPHLISTMSIVWMRAHMWVGVK